MAGCGEEEEVHEYGRGAEDRGAVGGDIMR